MRKDVVGIDYNTVGVKDIRKRIHGFGVILKEGSLDSVV